MELDQKKLVLVSQQCDREGFTNYMDLYLCWEFNDRVYTVRIRPCFYNDFKALMAISVKAEKGEPVEKYC